VLTMIVDRGHGHVLDLVDRLRGVGSRVSRLVGEEVDADEVGSLDNGILFNLRTTFLSESGDNCARRSMKMRDW